MKTNYKEVRYDIYCPKCVHEKKKESEDPCDECLEHGCGVDSKRPIHFKKK